jgi:DNA-binding winged helix-turn-helix (wHTH) protein
VTASIRFAGFELDPADRQLRRGGAPVELNGRYFDALALLVREAGRLVTKDRFMDEVWRGVPVTDEALTQCIRTLRRQLGDEAAAPRFIETVPKHGYRFIAPVEGRAARPAVNDDWARFVRLGLSGTAGGGIAGMLGGLFYGFAASQPGGGAISSLLVLLALTSVLALVGGAGVAFGIALVGKGREPRWYWAVLGGAAGGLLIGAIVRLLGLDGLALLFGRSPGDMTGAPEGAVLGAAVGVGFVLASRRDKLRLGAPLAALCGAVAGALIPSLGGRLLGGSLDLLAANFPESRLQIGQVGTLFGESGFGHVTEVATGALEGALFAGCVVCAMLLAGRSKANSLSPERAEG